LDATPISAEGESPHVKKAYVPYRGYYSTPFARWQGTLATENSIVLGAATSRRFLESKGWDPKAIDYVLVGSTVYQKQWFYSGPWAAAMMGAEGAPGVLINQACSTSTLSIFQAGMGIENGLFEQSWCLMADRMSKDPTPTPGLLTSNVPSFLHSFRTAP
jgi:acetyl-CoA acetyltransferase